MQTQIEQMKIKDTEENERRRYEANPWLEHTRWEKHISRKYKAWVVSTVKPDYHPPAPQDQDSSSSGSSSSGSSSDEDADDSSSDTSSTSHDDYMQSEAALNEACTATIQLIRHSFYVSRVDNVGRAAMEYVNRREAGGESSDRPLNTRQKVQTIRRYADKFVKILRYIWRTRHIEERPAYRLTPGQRDALDEVYQLAAIYASTRQTGGQPRTDGLASNRGGTSTARGSTRNRHV